MTITVVTLLQCAAIVVVGILLCVAIDKWVPWGEFKNPLKILIGILCAIGIVWRVLPLVGL